MNIKYLPLHQVFPLPSSLFVHSFVHVFLASHHRLKMYQFSAHLQMFLSLMFHFFYIYIQESQVSLGIQFPPLKFFQSLVFRFTAPKRNFTYRFHHMLYSSVCCVCCLLRFFLTSSTAGNFPTLLL